MKQKASILVSKDCTELVPGWTVPVYNQLQVRKIQSFKVLFCTSLKKNVISYKDTDWLRILFKTSRRLMWNQNSNPTNWKKNSDEIKSVWFQCITISGNAKNLSTVIFLKPIGVKNPIDISFSQQLSFPWKSLITINNATGIHINSMYPLLP